MTLYTLVYDVANRETFDALPRWYSELEMYVSSSVVKIVVGNKVDKVRLPSLRLSFYISNPCLAELAFCPSLAHKYISECMQEFSRQVSTAEGAEFAEKMGSLFIEASAKTSVGVREAFQEVVEKILDTPELWAPVSSVTPSRAKTSAGVGDGGMPGTIDLNARTEEDNGGGCMC
jgi:Ras-related protein Rab-18